MESSNRFVSECQEYSTYWSHVAAPIFRKSFVVKEPGEGSILICGLGFYDLYLNGEKITKGFLAPYISNPDHLICYDRYDITPYLRTGENVIAVMLGDGFLNGKTRVWDFMDNVFNQAPCLSLRAAVEDGHIIKEFYAADFSCKKGPVVFNDLRSGVFYDRRLEDAGWKEPGFVEDESWQRPIPVKPPRGKGKLCEAEPIVITKELSPVSITKGRLAPYTPREDVEEGLLGHAPQEPEPAREGGYIFDFGENNAGIFRLRIRGSRGQRVDLQCAEELIRSVVDYNNINFYPKGYAQRDVYILAGEGEEVFEPPFTYHGYRYLYVSGITKEQATEGLLTYLVMSSDLEERGAFCCSSKRDNQIYEMCERSDRSNFYYFPTDCPQREKNGWTGDAAASAEHMILTLEAERSFREWLFQIRLAQSAEGSLPGIVPTGAWGYDWGNGPAWDRVLFELPYRIWQYRGETEVIRENAHAMLRYLEYISRKRDERGIVAIGLGDHVPVDRDSAAYQVPVGFTDSVMVAEMCRQGAELFEAVGLPLHRAFAQGLGEEMRRDIRREYLDLGRMLVKGACQTGQAMGIYYGIFEPGERSEAFCRLLAIIRRDGEKITSGFLGLRVIFHVLSEFGESKLAYRMISGREYPSYGYFAEEGLSTVPEQFLSWEQRLKSSQNHHFLCDVKQWYIRYPGGIQVKDHKRVMIHPSFLKELSWVKASHRLPAGEVAVSWQREGERIRLEVRCPDDVRCELELDKEYYLEADGNTWKDNGRGIWMVLWHKKQEDRER